MPLLLLVAHSAPSHTRSESPQCLCHAASRLLSYNLLRPLRFHPNQAISNSTGFELRAFSSNNCNKRSYLTQLTPKCKLPGCSPRRALLIRCRVPAHQHVRSPRSVRLQTLLHTSQRYPASTQPCTCGVTHPSMCAQDNSWDSSTRDRAGSRMSYEESVNNDFDEPKPLSYPYDSFVKDMRSVKQPTISMPDLNVFIRPIIARSNARQAARQPQGNTRPPPYPLSGPVFGTTSEGSVHRAYSVRQPTAEDFLRPQHPLPAPPIEEYDSDQDLPIIEPDSHEYFFSPPNTHHTGVQPQTSNPDFPARHLITANAKSHRVPGSKPAHRRFQYALAGPSQSGSEHQNTPVRVNTMNSDMYQPALGGLQKISGIQRKDSKRDRVKRFMKNIIPFRREREFGRASRH
jgi:hypothetical protein